MKLTNFVTKLHDLLMYGDFRGVIALSQGISLEKLNEKERNEIFLYQSDAFSFVGDLPSFNGTLSRVHLDTNNDTKFHYHACVAHHWFMQGDYTKFQKCIHEFEDSYQNLDHKDKRLNQLYFKVLSQYCNHIIFFMRNSDLATKILSKMEEVSKKIKQDLTRSRLFLIYAWFDMLNNNHEKSFQHGQEALKIVEKNGSKYHLTNTYYFFGMHAKISGDVSGELFYFEKGLKLAEEIEYQYMAFVLGMHMGNYYFERGNLKKSLDCLKKAINIHEKIQNKWLYDFTMGIMGSIYYIQGEYKNALEVYKTVLENNEKISYDVGILSSQLQIGKIYLELGDTETSEKYFLNAVETVKSNSNFVVAGSYDLVFAFSDIIAFFMNQEKADKAEEIYRLLEERGKNSQIEHVQDFLKYAKVSLLKTSKKFKEIVEAQEILRKLLQEDSNFNFEFKMYIRLTLCEFLLKELEFSEDEDIWNEIEELIKSIDKLNKGQTSIFHVNILIIKAQLAVISEDFRQSIQFIDDALKLSERMGFEAKLKQIHEQKEDILTEQPSKITPKKMQSYIQDAMKYVNEWKSKN
ncbi:MAG: tetratricopeptide repeat protein [Promethearchaeota archaeon]|nr:MAG: tetratricopeptide repeat protein [Candidatus Lokiarchaeota archaeon]